MSFALRCDEVGVEHGAARVTQTGLSKTALQTDERRKLKAACEAFHCDPWVAVYVENAGSADLYLMSLEHFDKAYRTNKGLRDRRVEDGGEA